VSIVICDVSGITVIVDIGTRGPQGIPGVSPSSNNVVNYFTLTSTNILEKKITLNSIPAVPEKTILDVITGGPQKYETDFVVTGNELSWDGLNLDGELSEGEDLRVEYFT
jgi:hypothetical protein